jgi:glycosyltransferase involved in cell wall biosynthesis
VTTRTSSSDKRALVVSDSAVNSDPRVLNQIRWLIDEGWTVDSLGRGPRPTVLNGQHFSMRVFPFPIRLFSYVFLSNRGRFKVLAESVIPRQLRERRGTPQYDLAVIDEIDLLPWFDEFASSIVKPDGHKHLDLHEFSPSQGNGRLWKFLIGNHRDWLVTFIPSATFQSRSVVAPGIADLYVGLFDIPRPTVVKSAPELVDQHPSPVDPSNIELVHHGKADLERGLDILIDAVADLDSRFTLTLMLVGSAAAVRALKASASRFGSRVTFRDPVDVGNVAKAINEYDLEVIFFPPVTENLRHALPNKFFEAVQGRLGLVIGASPEMQNLVAQYENGVVADGWSSSDLAAAINSLEAKDVETLKQNSDAAAAELNSDREKLNFFKAVGLVVDG